MDSIPINYVYFPAYPFPPLNYLPMYRAYNPFMPFNYLDILKIQEKEKEKNGNNAGKINKIQDKNITSKNKRDKDNLNKINDNNANNSPINNHIITQTDIICNNNIIKSINNKLKNRIDLDENIQIDNKTNMIENKIKNLKEKRFRIVYSKNKINNNGNNKSKDKEEKLEYEKSNSELIQTENYELELQNQNNVNKDMYKLLIEQVFKSKNKANEYEIKLENFIEIPIDAAGNCFYCCLSYFFENNQKNHLYYRKKIFDYIIANKNDFDIFFVDNNDSINNYKSPRELLNEYILENKKPGKYAGDIELSAFVKIFPYKLYIFNKGFYNLNILNIFY